MTDRRFSKKRRTHRRRSQRRRGASEIARALGRLSDQITSDLAAEGLLRRGYIEKILHLTSLHYDFSCARLARPYFPLNDNWALTFLDTGEPFFIDTSDRDITPWVIMGGHWEPNVARPLLAFAGPGMTVLDVGAHMGYYTIKLGKKIGPKGRLLAFEPNPEILPFTEENIKLNDQVGISRVCPVALGDEKGEGVLKFTTGSIGRGSLVDQRDAAREFRVQVERIDDVVPKDWIIDLIKIDAEGYEKKILDGGSEVLERSPNCAIILELRLEGWEKFGSVETLADVCGEGKAIFGIEETGLLKPLAPGEIRSFLLSKKRPTGFHENYFFVVPEALARARVGDLIME